MFSTSSTPGVYHVSFSNFKKSLRLKNLLQSWMFNKSNLCHVILINWINLLIVRYCFKYLSQGLLPNQPHPPYIRRIWDLSCASLEQLDSTLSRGGCQPMESRLWVRNKLGTQDGRKCLETVQVPVALMLRSWSCCHWPAAHVNQIIKCNKDIPFVHRSMKGHEKANGGLPCRYGKVALRNYRCLWLPFTFNYDKSCMCTVTSNWFLTTWWWF